MEPEAEDIRLQAERLLWESGQLRPPIDVMAIVRYLGIEIIRTYDLPAAVSGLFSPDPDFPIISINARQALVRQRFAIAHEIRHALSGTGGVALLEPQRRSILPWEERTANLFAAELLMPARHVHNEHRRNPEMASLCWRFQVSKAAMGKRLRELSLL
jgi:Zn-dependent peptidase ImmA (M78 family)